ncbi:MAG: hypothetical protein ABSF46_15660, partial [Terriglobia bacterium]
ARLRRTNCFVPRSLGYLLNGQLQGKLLSAYKISQAYPGTPPKGRSNKAQAEGLGQWHPNRTPSSERAEQSFSIPNVPLIVGDSVRGEQLPEFLLEADHAVVNFLLRDVRRVVKAIAAWGNTCLAPSGLGVKLGDHLNPGRWPGLR